MGDEATILIVSVTSFVQGLQRSDKDKVNGDAVQYTQGTHKTPPAIPDNLNDPDVKDETLASDTRSAGYFLTLVRWNHSLETTTPC